MKLEDVGSIAFSDGDSGEDGWIFVRRGQGVIAMGLTLARNGDIDVALPRESVLQLIRILQEAIERT